MPVRASARVAVTVIIMGFTAACGGSSSGPDEPAAGQQAAPASQSRTADACRLLSPAEIAAAVGNAVNAGQPEAGPEVCDWDTDKPDDVSVLLTVRLKDSDRERVLCEDVRKAASAGTGFPGIGEAATWKFTSMGFFNSGDLEICDSRGFVGLSLNGKADADRLQAAAVTLARTVLGRL